MQAPEETSLYRVAVQMLQLRDLLQMAGIYAFASGQNRRNLLERLREERGTRIYEVCLSVEYTMSVLRTVARDLRDAYHTHAEADTICKHALSDFTKKKGHLPLVQPWFGGFGQVILMETIGDTPEENERLQCERDGVKERQRDMENRKAWHTNKTLNLALYDDDFGPLPTDKKDYKLVIRAPELVARDHASMWNEVERAVSSFH